MSSFTMDIEKTDAKIKIIGVGGGGGNALNCIVDSGVQNVDFISINTDVQALRKSKATEKIQIGSKLTHGLGAGGKPEIGEGSAQESKEEIADAIRDADMVFITAGMGGGTGTGAAPVVAEIAKELNILTVAVVTKPFDFEGQRKMAQAEKGIEQLIKNVDSLVVIPNQKLLTGEERVTMRQSFALADGVLMTAVRSVTEMILSTAYINVDFADVKSIMKNAGYAHMAIGHGEGKDKIQDAVNQVISSPLLETSIRGARRMLVNLVLSEDIMVSDVDEITKVITNCAAPDVDIIFGQAFDENTTDTIDITVIAADFGDLSRANSDDSKDTVKTETEKTSVDDFFDGYYNDVFRAIRGENN